MASWIILYLTSVRNGGTFKYTVYTYTLNDHFQIVATLHAATTKECTYISYSSRQHTAVPIMINVLHQQDQSHKD